MANVVSTDRGSRFNVVLNFWLIVAFSWRGAAWSVWRRMDAHGAFVQ